MEDVISYDDLLRYSDSISLYDKKNKTLYGLDLFLMKAKDKR